MLWEVLPRLGWVEARLLPPPSEIARTLADLAVRDLGTHVLASVTRVACGYAAGACAGVAVGIAIGLGRRAEPWIDPTFQALRAIPSLAWVPLLLLWLGIGEAPKIVLIALGSFFPVYLNTLSGIRDVDPKLIELGKTLGLTRSGIVRRIMLPYAAPSLFTGLRVGLSLAWMFLVAAELIAATSGIGYLLSEGRETSRPDLVFAAILLLAVLGKLSDGALKRVERRALGWRDGMTHD